MKRGLRVWTRTIIGGLVVLLMVAVAGCADAEPNSKGVARVPTSAQVATPSHSLTAPPSPMPADATDVEVVYASRERQPPILVPGDYDPLWGNLDTDVPIIEKLLNSIVMGTPVDLKAGTGASKREIVTIKTGWGGDEVEIEAFDGRTWLSGHSMAINIAFRDGTIWSVRQVIGCDVISEGRVNNCLPVPDHWELLHRNGVVVSTALTEWFERVEEYMPSVEHYGMPDQIRLGEPFAISGAGYHEGDRVELSIGFIDQSKLPLGEVPLDHGAFRWDGEFPKTAPTGYAIVSMRVFEGAEEVGGLTVSTTVTRSTAAGTTTPSPTPAEAEYSAADLARWYERLVDVRKVPGIAWTNLNEARNRIEIARIHRWTGMDGMRTAEGGEGVTDAMIRARIWVDGRLAGGLQALLGAPMAAYSGCGERDGGIGHGKRRSRTGLARVCRDVGLAGGSVADGRRQAGSGMARSRARARLNCSSQGQRRGRCRVNRRAERVIRPAKVKTRRLRVLVVTIC